MNLGVPFKARFGAPLKYFVALATVEFNVVFDSAELLTKAGEKAMDMESLQPVYDSHGKLLQTFCNFGTRNILREGGDHSLDNMTAAKMTDYEPEPWTLIETNRNHGHS
jgi:hypothetical protein